MRVSLVFEGTPEEISHLTQELKDDPDLELLVARLKRLVPEASTRVEVVSPERYITKEDFVSLGRSLGENEVFLARIWHTFGRAASSYSVRDCLHRSRGWSYNVEDLKAIDAPRLEWIPNFGKRSTEVFVRIVEAL